MNLYFLITATRPRFLILQPTALRATLRWEDATP